MKRTYMIEPAKMVKMNKVSFVALFLTVLCYPVSWTGSAEPNLPVGKAIVSRSNEHLENPQPVECNLSDCKRCVIIQDFDVVRVAKAELKGEFYKECVNSLQVALGIIVTIVAGFAVYAIFKDRQEYRRAVEDAKEACERTREYGREAQNKLDAIDKKVDEKLAEIEKKASERKEETERDRDISYQWNEAGRAYSAGDHEKAAQLWEKIYQDYKHESRPFYNNWGSSLLNWAKQKDKSDPERKALLEKAAEKFKKAEAYTRGIAAYNLACIYGNNLLNDEEECKKWLKVGEETGRLLTQERAMKEEDFGDFRNKEWFLKTRWKGE